VRIAQPRIAEIADTGKPRGRLRLGGERRGEEATRQVADERPPVHHSIT
jgi:hypothetical protein